MSESYSSQMSEFYIKGRGDACGFVSAKYKTKKKNMIRNHKINETYSNK